MLGFVIPDAIRDRHDGQKWNAIPNYGTTSKTGISSGTVAICKKIPASCAGMTVVCLFSGQLDKVKVLRSTIGFCNPDSRTLRPNLRGGRWKMKPNAHFRSCSLW